MKSEEMAGQIVEAVGGKENIRYATNCMTRLRIHVKENAKILDDAVRSVDGVLGIVHDRECYIEVVIGPGKVRDCAEACAAMGIPRSEQPDETAGNADVAGHSEPAKGAAGDDWRKNKAMLNKDRKGNPARNMLKAFGEIFVPMLPGIIAAGLCSGIATFLIQILPDYAEHPFWSIVYNMLLLISGSFLTYLTAWAGYRAAECFGATPILGGMLGIMTIMGNITIIAQILGLTDEARPLNSILREGRGGVLAAVIGVWVLSKVEKAVRKYIPPNLDIMLTPLLTLLICAVPYVFIIMPVTGFISSELCFLIEKVCMSELLPVRLITGFVLAAVFLPMVAVGMHHGLVALYAVQLENAGYITMYPALAMAGAGQVGASAAVYFKAKKAKNRKLCSAVSGALPAGVLGVGEPLVYGVTLPLGKPFLTAGLGAGFGGAFVAAMEVASTTWGPSGILAFPVMTSGPEGAVKSMICYGIGLLISYVMSFIITYVVIKTEDVAPVK